MPVVARDYTGWILMLIAVGLGLAAFFLIRQYLGSEGARLRDEARKSRGDMAQVVVAMLMLLPLVVVVVVLVVVETQLLEVVVLET